MRSLIILEVEHGEDTDALQPIAEAAMIEADGMVKSWTVRVDLPACFVLDSVSAPFPMTDED